MRKIKINGVYRHFKGNYYIVLDIGVHSETEEECVIYRSLSDGKIWIRPIDIFLNEVDHEKYPEVKQKYRFELQDIKKHIN